MDPNHRFPDDRHQHIVFAAYTGGGVASFQSVAQTVTPAFHQVWQDVSRQLQYAASPMFDKVLLTDIMAAWDGWLEVNLCATILAGGTTFGTSFTTATFTGAAPVKAVRSMATAASHTKRGRANVAIMSVAREEAFLGLAGSSGDWLVHTSTDADSSPVDIRGIPGVSTEGIDDALSPDLFAVMNSQAVLLLESPLSNFSFEQAPGTPSLIRMGATGTATALVRFPTAVQVCTVSP